MVKKIKAFFLLVELPTKIVSFSAFWVALVYLIYQGVKINVLNTVLFFVAALLFDMDTTAINNTIDYSKSQKKEGYNYEKKNALKTYNMKLSTAITIIFVLLVLSIAIGVYLAYTSGVEVLLLGALCFFIGIFYTFGPIPISRMPLGEVFSGIFMGLFIPLLLYMVNTKGLFILEYQAPDLVGKVNVAGFLKILVACVPLIMTTANIMLANNTCDLEEDVINRRYTIVYYLGRPFCVELYLALYVISYLSVIAAPFFGVFPWTAYLNLLTFPVVFKNYKKFKGDISKERTFPLAIQNFVLINFSVFLGTLIGIFLK